MKILNAVKVGNSSYRLNIELDAETDNPEILEQLNFPFFDTEEKKEERTKAVNFPSFKEFVEKVNKPKEP